jgi:hypothetical protein
MCRYLIIFISLISLIITEQVYARERIALVIGNADYQIYPLKNPTNDARDIAKVLRKLGFTVILETDANQAIMERAIRLFGKKLYRGAVGLFYYSGHGIQYNGANYLIPIRAMASVSTPYHLRYKAVNAGYVLEVMKAAGNGLNIVILDACRDNPFKSLSKSVVVNRGLARMPSAEGTLIAYATSPGKTAADGWGDNSPYTKHLLQFIQQPNLSIEIILKKVRAAVKQETNGQQTPWYEASIDGDFYFSQEHNIRQAVQEDNIRQAEIINIRRIYPSINKGDCLNWSSPEMKANGGIEKWNSFFPKKGDIGTIVDEMSHCYSGEKIYLLKIDQYYIPINQDGVRITH